jgi:hypothetical protein
MCPINAKRAPQHVSLLTCESRFLDDSNSETRQNALAWQISIDRPLASTAPSANGETHPRTTRRTVSLHHNAVVQSCAMSRLLDGSRETLFVRRRFVIVNLRRYRRLNIARTGRALGRLTDESNVPHRASHGSQPAGVTNNWSELHTSRVVLPDRVMTAE